MTGRYIWATTLKDLRRRVADRLALLLWLGIPITIGLLMVMVSGGSNASPRGVVLLVDEDAALLGRAIETSLAQGPLKSLFEVQRVSRPEADARIEEGEAAAMLVVPAGATDAFLDQRPVALTLIKNPSQRILPTIAEDTTKILVEAMFYIQRVFAEPLRTFTAQSQEDGFPADVDVAALATAINARLRELKPLLLPPVFELKVDEPNAGADMQTPLDLARIFLPGLIFMSLLFVAQGTTGDIWDEHAAGTLRRALSAPAGAFSFLVGKLLASAILIAGISFVALTIGVLLFQVPIVRALMAWPWAVFGGTVLVALFLVPQLVATSRRGADMLANLVMFPLMMIGGSFFPFEAMPGWMAAIGRWTPNGQAVLRLKDFLGGTVSLPTLAAAAAAMALPAVGAALWATGQLRTKFSGGR